MKLMIEVDGGCITNIVATGEISIVFVDHDNLEEGRKKVAKETRKPMQPYLICDDQEFAKQVDEVLEEYETCFIH